MIKVIRESCKYRCVCPKCESILEADKTDFQCIQTGRQEYKDIIICPICHNKIESCYWKKEKNNADT